jgi:hypothetical protein
MNLILQLKITDIYKLFSFISLINIRFIYYETILLKFICRTTIIHYFYNHRILIWKNSILRYIFQHL